MSETPVSRALMSGRSHAVWTVQQLLSAVAEALALRVGQVVVAGELGAVTRASSGHCYFALKDWRGSATVRCVMFRRAAQACDVELLEGLAVEICGRVSLYEPRGELQLMVEAVRSAGVGALYEEFLRRKARLEAEGLLDAGRKRPLPRWPRAVGVITSLSGAVLHDFCTTMARRAPHMPVVVYPAAVQGTSACASLTAALNGAIARGEVDVLALCRGGGSMEDLWAFNDEGLARAVALSPLPVVAGIGHETDVTLVDSVADLRAPTPTAAAEMICLSRRDEWVQLGATYQHIKTLLQSDLDRYAQQLDRAALRLARPATRLQAWAQKLSTLAMTLQWARRQQCERHQHSLSRTAEALQRLMRRGTDERQQRLRVLAARLQALDPQAVLARGYARVSDASGQAVTHTTQVRRGQRLCVTWHDGHAQVEVQDTPGMRSEPVV